MKFVNENKFMIGVVVILLAFVYVSNSNTIDYEQGLSSNEIVLAR